MAILIVAINLTDCVLGILEPIETLATTASTASTATVTIIPTPSPTPTMAPTPTECIYESGYTFQSEKDGITLI